MAQAQNRIFLTNYTFSTDRREVGEIIFDGENNKSGELKLTGEDAASFEIDKKNKLLLKQNADLQKKVYNIVIENSNGSSSFSIVKDEFLKNKVIAHRGGWKNTGASENSVAALKHAIRLGCEGSEFDVFMSADSVLFVNHDPEINGVSIEKTNAEELKKMLLSNNEPLPTLEAYLLEGMKQNNTKLILEIKPSKISKERSVTSAEKVYELVRKLKAQAWVEYISFDYDILLKIKQLSPFAKVAYLNGEKSPAELAKDGLYGLDYHFTVLRKNEKWIDEANKLGLTVNVWTINDENLMEWFLLKKVDFITTNEPEKLLQKVKQK